MKKAGLLAPPLICVCVIFKDNSFYICAQIVFAVIVDG